MAIYTVHNRLVGKDDPMFVKDGFSWPGFVFTFIWLLYKRMWVVASVAAAAMFVASFLSSASANPGLMQSLFSLVMSMILGFEGNELQRWSLTRRGYRETALLQGDDPEEAELKYFADRTETTTAAGAAVVRAQPHVLATDALGLFSVPDGKP
jgi:Protein of unknown function (DUF2628)